MTTIVLVRHGETEWNRSDRFRGRYDVPLNDAGISQAKASAERIREEFSPRAVYSSPLSRAMTTARIIADLCALPVRTHPGLVDIDYGEWQGLSVDEVNQHWPDLSTAWRQKPETAAIPGGESLSLVRERALEAVRELARRHDGETIVMVSHTVVNRLILLGVLGAGNDRFWRLRQDTCAINLIFAEGPEYSLGLLNDTGHLRDARGNPSEKREAG
jgi:probable phosphoglycerate mutase